MKRRNGYGRWYLALPLGLTLTLGLGFDNPQRPLRPADAHAAPHAGAEAGPHAKPPSAVPGAGVPNAGASNANRTGSTRKLLSIPFERYQLDNGFTVILHEDHTQPLVVVNINVNVGSRDEPAGRTGFAHLFEHLMFMGTARVPEKKFDAWMEREGGWNNAWTSEDRTDYYDVAPSHALPLLLWMEADRLASLGGEMDAAKLETQRGVVRNERRQQTENRPYASARLRLPELLYPKGHPYHHPVIGSHADLEAATVADVTAFFNTWYVPANMSLVVAGDFSPAEIKPLINRYFATLKVREGLPKRTAPAQPAALNSVVRDTMEDNVSTTKVVISWLSPALYQPGDAELDVLAQVLASGKGSRLYKRLVYDDQLAQSVVAYQASGGLRSHFNVEVIANPGVDPSAIEAAVDEEIATLRRDSLTAKELARAKNQYEARFISRMQSLETRASMLNGYFASVGKPDYASADLQRYLKVTVAAAKQTAITTLDPQRRVILHIVPRKKAPPEQPEAPPAKEGQP